MIRNISGHITRLFLYFALQVLLFREVAFFDLGYNFIYIMGLLLLPIELGHILLIFVGFITGLGVDLFYNTQGIQAMACTLIMFVRPYHFNWTTGGNYEPGTTLNVRSMGLSWFVLFALPLILLHQLVVFFVEAGSWNLFWFTLSKVFFSTIFTFVVAVILQYLSTKPGRRR